MKIAATEFKARCLALLGQCHDTGKPITITTCGKVVATPQPAGDFVIVRRSVAASPDVTAEAV